MFKKESLEFDIGTPRYCLRSRSRLKIRRFTDSVRFACFSKRPPPFPLSSPSFIIPDQTPLLFDSVCFLRRKEIFDIMADAISICEFIEGVLPVLGLDVCSDCTNNAV